jgi:HK97 gp10 family phage protein
MLSGATLDQKGSVMSVSIELTNKKEIIQLLDKLPRAFESKAVRKLIKYAIVPAVNEAKRLAPVAKRSHLSKYGWIKPGTLRDSIGAIDMKRSKNVTVIVGPRVKGKYGKALSGYYGMWIEFGHNIRRSAKGKFQSTERGKAVGGDIKPKPFMRPAWDNTHEVVKQRFERDAKKVFEKEIAKWTKQGKI